MWTPLSFSLKIKFPLLAIPATKGEPAVPFFHFRKRSTIGKTLNRRARRGLAESAEKLRNLIRRF